jgi:DNA modification methylase
VTCQAARYLSPQSVEEFQGKLKTLTKENYQRLKNVIVKHGFCEPISVWEYSPGKYHILNGHQRIRTVLEMVQEGWECPDLPVNPVEASDINQARKIVLALASQYGQVDSDGLYEFLQGTDVSTDDMMTDYHFADLDIPEFITGYLDDEPPPEPDPEKDDNVPDTDQNAFGVEPGQIWKLGDHRLMCGDSTNQAAVRDLTAGIRINLIATSPPYSDQRDYNIGSFDWLKLMTGVSDTWPDIMADTFNILVNLGPSHKDGKVDFYWWPWLEQCGMDLFGLYIWDKGFGMPGDYNGRLASSHEFLFHFKNGKIQANKIIKTKPESRKRDHDFRAKDGSIKKQTSPDKVGQPFKIPDSVIRINKELTRGIHTQNHPAVFPVALPEFIINTWSKKNDSVLEPFCGSGSTLIACEKTGRKCYGSEIDPHYCSVIIKRYIDYVGTDSEVYLVDGKKKIPLSEVQDMRK